MTNQTVQMIWETDANVIMDRDNFSHEVREYLSYPGRPQANPDEVITILGRPIFRNEKQICIFHHCDYCGTEKKPINQKCCRCGAPIFPGMHGIPQ